MASLLESWGISPVKDKYMAIWREEESAKEREGAGEEALVHKRQKLDAACHPHFTPPPEEEEFPEFRVQVPCSAHEITTAERDYWRADGKIQYDDNGHDDITLVRGERPEESDDEMLAKLKGASAKAAKNGAAEPAAAEASKSTRAKSKATPSTSTKKLVKKAPRTPATPVPASVDGPFASLFRLFRCAAETGEQRD